MSEKNEQDGRHGLSRRSLLAGAAVGGAGLAASIVEASPVSAAVAPRGGGPARPLAIEKEPGVGLMFLLAVPSIGNIGPFSELEIPGPETSIIEYRDGSDPDRTSTSPASRSIRP
jgi:hypothetical protein